MSKKSIVMMVIVFLMMSNSAYAFRDALGINHSGVSFGAGVLVGTMISKKSTNRKKRYKSTKRRTPQKKYVAPVMTSGKKIQKSLTALGFYHGKIDGEINSYETRSAIKSMHVAYNAGNGPSLTLEERDTLIYLGDLFIFDRLLISRDTNEKEKNKKIQAALKIHGFYHDEIDGIIGAGTRRNISEYKEAKGLSLGSALDYEEEYKLFSTAAALNSKNIDESVASLKHKRATTNTSIDTNSTLKKSPEENKTKQTPPIKGWGNK